MCCKNRLISLITGSASGHIRVLHDLRTNAGRVRFCVNDFVGFGSLEQGLIM
ncbi:hypothetical protein HMPREF3214_01065 [Alloscardovia omnicolens]|nr:hypothetical protein HMPREF3214_01065 [Alloscardovia omnicolens]